MKNHHFLLIVAGAFIASMLAVFWFALPSKIPTATTPSPGSAGLVTLPDSKTPPATSTPPSDNPAPPAENPDSNPPQQGSAQVLRTVSVNLPIVSLTFDAGADRGFAADILDTLKQEGVRASFGMTGKWAEQHPDLVRRMVDEGHELINHTYSHDSFTGFSTQKPALTQLQRWQELDRTQQIIHDLTGATTKPYFRPPFGDYNAGVNRDIYARGYHYNVMWTVDSLGWKGLTAEQIRQRVVGGTVPGAIHLFHVGAQSQDAAALPLIISDLRAQGYTFGTIADLLAS